MRLIHTCGSLFSWICICKYYFKLHKPGQALPYGAGLGMLLTQVAVAFSAFGIDQALFRNSCGQTLVIIFILRSTYLDVMVVCEGEDHL